MSHCVRHIRHLLHQVLTLASETCPVARLTQSYRSIQVGSSKIQLFTVVCNLGLLLNSELSMKNHLAKVTATYHCHLRRLRQIRRRVGQEVTTPLVLASVISRLDYCNAALAGLP